MVCVGRNYRARTLEHNRDGLNFFYITKNTRTFKGYEMAEKPTYEELERRVQELEKIESEQKYSKEALRETENLFKMLYEKAPLVSRPKSSAMYFDNLNLYAATRIFCLK
jgi:hypothetical protein